MLLLALSQGAAAKTPSSSATVGVGHTFTELWDTTVSSPTPSGPQHLDGVKSYAVLATGHGHAEFHQKVIDPVPSDGSILTGGAIISGHVEHLDSKTVSTARMSAWVRVDKLELLGGSAKGGITIRHLLVNTEQTCGKGITTAGSTFSGLEVGGLSWNQSPAPNTTLNIAGFTVILNEQHVNPVDLGVSLVGVHVLSAGPGLAGAPIDVRIGTIATATKCERPPTPSTPAELSLELSTSDKEPLGDRAMTVIVRLRNTSLAPCRLTTVEFQPGSGGWRTSATAGALGTTYTTSNADVGDAWLSSSLTLAPGSTIEQSFVVTERKGNQTRLLAGSHAQATCSESGLWGSPLGAFPRA